MTKTKKSPASAGEKWLGALEAQKLEVHSARDALAVKGWVDSGNFALNWAMSGRFLRGYPLGHTVEIFGDPSTGKSFLITRLIAMIQSMGGVAMLDDTEGAYNLDWIGNLGVNVDQLAYRRSRTVKDHLNAAKAFVAAFKGLGLTSPGVLACDSLSLLSTTHELEVGLDKPDMSKAKELKTFFRLIGGDLSDLPVIHVSTSHVIAKIGDMWNPRTTAGGGGPKFQASVRIDLRGLSKIKHENEYVGAITRVFIEKNRIVAPWKEVRIAIPFYRPISRSSGLIPVLLHLGILGVHGQTLEYKGNKLRVRAHLTKKSFLEQDQSAEQLLDEIPEILEEADEVLASRVVDPASWENAVETDSTEAGAEEEAEPDEVTA